MDIEWEVSKRRLKLGKWMKFKIVEKDGIWNNYTLDDMWVGKVFHQALDDMQVKVIENPENRMIKKWTK